MPALNPTTKGNKVVTKITSGVLTNPWDGLVDGYNIFRIKDINVNQFNALLLNIRFAGGTPFTDSTMGDISLGLINGTHKLTATGEPLKTIAGSLDWNVSPYVTDSLLYNFLWTNSDVNIDDMTPKFTGVEGIYPEYPSVTQFDKTAVLPFISNSVDIFFRQEPKSVAMQFAYTLFGINNIT